MPDPYPPWHITFVMCGPNTSACTLHLECANTLRSAAHCICNVRGLYPLFHITHPRSRELLKLTTAPRGGGHAVKNVSIPHLTALSMLSIFFKIRLWTGTMRCAFSIYLGGYLFHQTGVAPKSLVQCIWCILSLLITT